MIQRKDSPPQEPLGLLQDFRSGIPLDSSNIGIMLAFCREGGTYHSIS